MEIKGLFEFIGLGVTIYSLEFFWPKIAFSRMHNRKYAFSGPPKILGYGRLGENPLNCLVFQWREPATSTHGLPDSVMPFGSKVKKTPALKQSHISAAFCR